MLQLGRLGKGELDAECRCGRGRCHSGGFLLRFMPPSWNPVPACVRHGHSAGGPFFCAATMVLQAGCSSVRQRWCCRRAVLSCSSDDAASIRKSEPEIKNRCTLEGINRQNPALIRKSGHEIKNQCTKEGGKGENLASIPKSGLEIKNRCSRGVVAVCRRNHSPLPLRKLESDADLVAATTTAGGPFFSAAKKIRIGRGDSLQKVSHPQQIPSTRSIMC